MAKPDDDGAKMTASDSSVAPPAGSATTAAGVALVPGFSAFGTTNCGARSTALAAGTCGGEVAVAAATIEEREKEVCRREKGNTQWEEALGQREEEVKEREEIGQREEQARLKEAQVNRWKELRRREEQAKQWMEVIQREKAIKQLEEEVREREAALKQLEEEVRKREENVRLSMNRNQNWYQYVSDRETAGESGHVRNRLRRRWVPGQSEGAAYNDGRDDLQSIWQPLLQVPQPTKMQMDRRIPAPPFSPSSTMSDSTGKHVMPPPALATPQAKEADETWNKRQIRYVLHLGTAMAYLFLVRPYLPRGYDRWMIAAFASIWGLGSVGLPFGLFGMTRCEKNSSRHVGHVISTCSSLFVIYALYLLAMHVEGSDASPPPSPSPLGVTSAVPTADKGDPDVTSAFFFIGFLVFIGHVVSWIMGCVTGGDRDRDP